MRNANHYARTRELAALRPSHRIPHQKDSNGQLKFWAKTNYQGLELILEDCGHSVDQALSSPVGGQPVFAYANHGRWVADCPCGGAQLVHPDDRQFMCVDCGNHWNDHQWAEVIWPDEWEHIEELLDVRQQPLANWRIGETLEDLEKENIFLKKEGLFR